MPRLAAIAALFLLMTLAAIASTGRVEEVVCPVCQAKQKATFLFSSNTAGGADPDFMERCGGGFPLIICPVMCPKCKFVAPSGEVLEQPVAEKLKTALLQADPPFIVAEHRPIKPNGPLRGAFTEGLDAGDTAPAWVRYDMMAQQAPYKDATPLALMQIQQRAAWSVRLEENPFQQLGMDLTREQWSQALQGMPKRHQDSNPAEDQIEAGRQLLRASELSRPNAIIAGYLLRTHGELPDLEAAMPRLLEAIHENGLEDQLKTSFALERKYLERTLVQLQEVMRAPPKDVEPAILQYLQGELQRRLGRPQEAASSYQSALAGKLPEWLQKQAKKQSLLVTSAVESTP